MARWPADVTFNLGEVERGERTLLQFVSWIRKAHAERQFRMREDAIAAAIDAAAEAEDGCKRGTVAREQPPTIVIV